MRGRIGKRSNRPVANWKRSPATVNNTCGVTEQQPSSNTYPNSFPFSPLASSTPLYSSRSPQCEIACRWKHFILPNNNSNNNNSNKNPGIHLGTPLVRKEQLVVLVAEVNTSLAFFQCQGRFFETETSVRRAETRTWTERANERQPTCGRTSCHREDSRNCASRSWVTCDR